jgi:glucosamine--fructose-6-phosphate aminotransferase (isomerizing)
MIALAAAPSELERAIAAQPGELERLLRTPIPHDTIERLRQAHRIWLVGTGTSQHAAELGAAMFHDAGRAAYAVPSMRFVNWAPPVDAADAVIVISHNAGAETSYAAAAYTMGMSAGLRVIAITRRGGRLLEALETVDQERSHTYTVSYTSALVLLARLANTLGAETFAPEILADLPDAVSAAIADPGTGSIPLPERALVLFGEGPAGVTAREGALKVREAARVLAEGYDVELLLHGSAVPLDGRDHLVALAPPDTDGLTAAVAAAAEAEGIGVTALTEPSDLPPILAQIPLTVRLQVLASRFSIERRTNPDVAIERAWAAESLWSIGAPGSGPFS